MKANDFCTNLFEYERVTTREVPVGELVIGGKYPIRVQSMTTTDTKNTEASVAQAIRVIEAGGQLVRLTTPGRDEAENLKNIVATLHSRGYISPIVADVHFNPAVAEVAANYADKVRINPGNYIRNIDGNLSDEDYKKLICEKIEPLVKICKAKKVAIRIGVNHGSLSPRIVNKYGDTPRGMVASCIEYIEGFEALDFKNLVISIKASNTRIMVETVRLLMATMRERKVVYPVHLGVTEAGNDVEGRIKSAVGIGALLIDGLGDTIRVSLTEAPEAEVPVAQTLVDYLKTKKGKLDLPKVNIENYSPYEYSRRKTVEILGIGGKNQPVLIADSTGRKRVERCGAEFVYTNDAVIDDGYFISDQKDIYEKYDNCYPLLSSENLSNYKGCAFVRLNFKTLNDAVVDELKKRDNVVIIFQPQTNNVTVEIRTFVLKMSELGVGLPIVAWLRYNSKSIDAFQIESAADIGMLFIDGLIDGLMLSNFNFDQSMVARTALEIMQAARVKFTKAEFISCPACGRTQYNIEQATHAIKEKFGHLTGLKIAVMGCIVNGPGEMADADYGYVGAGGGKISLYRGKELVKKALPEADAIEELQAIIATDGKWKEVAVNS